MNAQRITITDKLWLKGTKMHRAGIHVDRCCPQWKVSAPSENPAPHWRGSPSLLSAALRKHV